MMMELVGIIIKTENTTAGRWRAEEGAQSGNTMLEVDGGGWRVDGRRWRVDGGW